jgi:hypothetical protein
MGAGEQMGVVPERVSFGTENRPYEIKGLRISKVDPILAA